MDTADNKRVLEQIYVGISSGNLEPLLAHLADDVVWTIIGSTPLSGTFRGKQDVIEHLLRPLGAALDGHVRFTFDRFIAEGEYVVMLARGHGTAKSGRPYNNTYCIVCRFVDGKVREITDYVDTELITSALFGQR
ncbi:MAG TPA: nuclear transport factor 2 family protein [Pseudonocardiaceae bacterium]